MHCIQHEVPADYCQQSLGCSSAVIESTLVWCACIVVYIQLSPSHTIHAGVCDWSSGDRIIYRIFAR